MSKTAPKKRDYTFEEMRRALVVGWGELGERVAQCWRDFNRLYFADELLPLPIFLTATMPYGRMIGWTCCADAVTHIALASPNDGTILVADRGVLLHEMIHQFLHERGERFGHQGEPWRREIMRLHLQITGKTIWAGAYTVGKRPGLDGIRRSARFNRPDPATGRESIGQMQIASWPGSLKIRLGSL
jgi:hypothetical protein